MTHHDSGELTATNKLRHEMPLNLEKRVRRIINLIKIPQLTLLYFNSDINFVLHAYDINKRQTKCEADSHISQL